MDNAYECITTEFIPAKEGVIVFSTKKSLNERFTPHYRRCVFVINNGYTTPLKGNKIKDKIVIRSRAQINTHSRFSLYTKYYHGNREEEIGRNELKTKMKEVVHQEVNKRRIVLLPAKKNDDRQTTDFKKDQSKKLTVFETNHGISPVYRNPREKLHTNQVSELDNFRSPTSSRNVRNTRRFQNRLPNFRATRSTRNYPNNSDKSKPLIYSKRDNFKSSSFRRSRRDSERFRNCRSNFRTIRSTPNYRNNSDESEPIIYSPFLHKNNENCLRSPYRWSRARLTKEDLDLELDSYMSEVHFKPQPALEEENIDSFVEEYILESEKCLNGEENEDIDMIYLE